MIAVGAFYTKLVPEVKQMLMAALVPRRLCVCNMKMLNFTKCYILSTIISQVINIKYVVTDFLEICK